MNVENSEDLISSTVVDLSIKLISSGLTSRHEIKKKYFKEGLLMINRIVL